MITLGRRLRTAFELCRSGLSAADVGTDHALLAVKLAQEKSRLVYAADIADGPLEAARRTVLQYGSENVVVLKSDGLEKIPFADDVCILGMGGELIAEIVLKCGFTNENTRFILQPMTRADALRRTLCGAGFSIIEERTALDAGRLYSVMLWKYSGEPRDIDEIYALCGENHDAEYLKSIAAKLLKNAEGMRNSDFFSEDAAHAEELAGKISELAENTENIRKS